MRVTRRPTLVVGGSRPERSPSPETVAAVKGQYGLDQPFLTQYLHWLGGVLHGDFGRSFQFRDEGTTLMGVRLGTTLLLMVMSALLINVVGLGAGILGALTVGRAANQVRARTRIVGVSRGP